MKKYSGGFGASIQRKLYTPRMYRAFILNKDDRQGMPEFRPVAVRGMLRYGFWARSLGIYLHPECKTWEAELFGTIEPRSQEGRFSLRT